MSDGMLGRLPLSAVQGPRDTLDEHLAGRDGELWLAELKKFNAKKPCWPSNESASASVVQQPAKLLSIVATTSLAGIGGKKTKKCFTGSRYYYRDSDLDRWLPANQPKCDACVISTLAPTEDVTFAQWSASILGVATDTPVETLANLLKERGYVMTLAQVEAMVDATERGETTGLRTDNWGNFFFVEDNDGGVSVGYVDRDDRDWDAHVDRLGSGGRWRAGDRILVRNLDTSKL